MMTIERIARAIHASDDHPPPFDRWEHLPLASHIMYLANARAVVLALADDIERVMVHFCGPELEWLWGNDRKSADEKASFHHIVALIAEVRGWTAWRFAAAHLDEADAMLDERAEARERE